MSYVQALATGRGTVLLLQPFHEEVKSWPESVTVTPSSFVGNEMAQVADDEIDGKRSTTCAELLLSRKIRPSLEGFTGFTESRAIAPVLVVGEEGQVADDGINERRLRTELVEFRWWVRSSSGLLVEPRLEQGTSWGKVISVAPVTLVRNDSVQVSDERHDDLLSATFAKASLLLLLVDGRVGCCLGDLDSLGVPGLVDPSTGSAGSLWWHDVCCCGVEALVR